MATSDKRDVSDDVRGYGRIVITSSDSTQLAFEGDKVIGQAKNSLFTYFLIKGLEGEADQNGDGLITISELYEYAYDRTRQTNPQQQPSMASSKLQGEIILRQIKRTQDIQLLQLPKEVVEALTDANASVRESGVYKLANLLYDENPVLAQSARSVLERIAAEDDSRRVGDAAKRVLDSIIVITPKSVKLKIEESEKSVKTQGDNKTNTFSFDSSGKESIQTNMGSVLFQASQKLRVFLCHSSGDKPAVRELCQKLNAKGWIDVWLDEEKLLPGQDWEFEIEKALDNSDAVIVSLSRSSITKEGYVQKELRFVIDIALEKPEGAIFILPVRLEECEPPRKLRTYQYADYFPVEQRERAFQRLLASLRIRAQGLGIPVVD